MKVTVFPLRSEENYQEALAEIERLWGAPAESEAGARLDMLMDLVEAYERKHFPIYPPMPLDAIQFAMDQKGLRPVDLGPILGSTPRAYEVLGGKRQLSLRMIRALHQELGIPLESLIGKAA